MADGDRCPTVKHRLAEIEKITIKSDEGRSKPERVNTIAQEEIPHSLGEKCNCPVGVT